jgi:hypothetical protein
MLAERLPRASAFAALAGAVVALSGCGGSSGPKQDLTAQQVQAAFAAAGIPVDLIHGKATTEPSDAVLLSKPPSSLVVLLYRSETCAKRGVLDPTFHGGGCPSGPPLRAPWPRVRNVVVEADDTGKVHDALDRLRHSG